MDCRKSLVLAAFILALGSGGCVGLQQRIGQTFKPATTTSTVVSKSAEPQLPQSMAAHKAKDEPKRKPLPSTVVALAVVKEREGDAEKDPAKAVKARDAAREMYQDALKIDANCREAQQGLVRVYMKMDDYEHAFDLLRKAIAKNPKDATLWMDMGMAHNRKKEWNEACRCFQKALDIDPENRQYMQTLGFTLARAGQIDQSLAVLTKAQGAALAHFNVARMLMHVGQADTGRRHLDIALQLNPNLEQARELQSDMDGANQSGPRPTLNIQFPTE